MKIIIKRAGKDPKIEVVDVKYRSDLFGMINAELFDTIRLSEDGLFQMWVDEEGMLKELPINFLIGVNNPHYPIQIIVGDVIFARIQKPDYMKELYDYEIDDINAMDLKIMYDLLSEKHQYELYSKYKQKSEIERGRK